MIDLRLNADFDGFFALAGRGLKLYGKQYDDLMNRRISIWSQLNGFNEENTPSNKSGILVNAKERFFEAKNLKIRIATFETKLGVYFQDSCDYKKGGYSSGISIGDHLIAEDETEATIAALQRASKHKEVDGCLVDSFIASVQQKNLF